MQDLDLQSRPPNPMVRRHGGDTKEDRICVDLKPLNANVLRETHPLPAVDEVLLN